jgi:hypothetical protein
MGRTEPFDAHLELTPDRMDLAEFSIRFGDRRSFPEETLQDNLNRIPREIEQGAIDWLHVFRPQVQRTKLNRATGVLESASCQKPASFAKKRLGSPKVTTVSASF